MAEEKCCSSSAVPFQLVEKITGRPSRKPKFGRSQKPEEKKRRRANIHLVRRLHGAFDFILFFFTASPPHAAAFVAPNGRRVEKFSSLSSEKMANNYRPIMFFRKGRRGCPVSRSIHFSMNYDRGRPERTWGSFFLIQIKCLPLHQYF